MSKEFDVIEFETEREKTYERSKSIQLEISSQHNYTDGITYFYLHTGDLKLGHYYRDPWGNGWYWYSSISGEKARCPSKAIALTKIQLEWLRWSR